MLGTQHYRQHWRRVSTLRAGKTNRVYSDLMFTSALRGWLVFVGFFCVFCVQTDCLQSGVDADCGLEGGGSGRVRVCSPIHTSVPPSSLFRRHERRLWPGQTCLHSECFAIFVVVLQRDERGGLLHNASQPVEELQKPETLSVFFF